MGTVSGSGPSVTYTAPGSLGTYRIDVIATDGKGGSAQKSIFVSNRKGNLVINSIGVDGQALDSYVYVYKQDGGSYLTCGSTGSDGAITFSLLEDIYKIKVRESNDIWVKNILVLQGNTGIVIGNDTSNEPPRINSYYPENLNLNISSNAIISFKLNASDPDWFNPQFRWYLDGVFKSALPEWTYYVSQKDIGERVVVAEVTDGQYSVYQKWNVTVKNDSTAPSSIGGFQHKAGFDWLNWTWANPSDSDFFHTEIYLDGLFLTNTSAEFFNATGLQPETNYTISTRTVDTYGNINETWVNSTATTKKAGENDWNSSVSNLKLTTALSDTYSLGEPVILNTNIKNIGETSADIRLEVRTDDGYSSSRKVTIQAGSAYTPSFNIATSGIGSYTATINIFDGIVLLESSSQTFKVIDPASLLFVEDEAESLKKTAISEFNKMAGIPASASSNVIMNFGFDVLKESVSKHLSKPADAVKNVDGSGIDDSDVSSMVEDTEKAIVDDIESSIEDSVSVSIIRQINEASGTDIPETIDIFHLKDSVSSIVFEKIKGLFEDILTGVIKDYVVKPTFTQVEEDKVILRDSDFDTYAEGSLFSLSPDSRTRVLQRFNAGRCAISSVTDSKALFTVGPYEIPCMGTFSYSVTLTEEYNKFKELDDLKGLIGTVAAALAVIGTILVLVISILGTGGTALGPLIAALPQIIGWLKTITSVLIPVTMSLVTVGMFFTVPIIAPEVSYQHDTTLDTIEDIISSESLSVSVNEMSTSSAYINSPTSTSMKIVNREPVSLNPITETMVVSPDGRIIDIKREDPYVAASSSAKITHELSTPQKPGKYQVVGMVHSGGVATSATLQEMEVDVPAISIALESDRNAYNPGEPITISANFTNNEASDISDLIYVLEVVNTSTTDADMMTLGASSSRIEDLTFTTNNEGSYIAKATLLLGLSEIAVDSIGFSVGSGEGLLIAASPDDLYASETNVTVPISIENIGTVHTSSTVNISTYDELAGFTQVYTSRMPVSLDASASDTFNISVLPDAAPGIYRTILKAENFSAESFEYTVTANGTIFTLLETDKPYYNLTEPVLINTTVNDILFSKTSAAVNLTVSEPSGTLTYPSIVGDTGFYTAQYDPAINGTYDISATSAKTGFRSYSDETFVIVGQRSILRADLPKNSIFNNDTSMIELQVKNELNKSINNAIVSLTGCGVNSTEISDYNGNISLRITPATAGSIVLKVEKGGYAAYRCSIDVVSQPNDWNPWDGPDSEGGKLITTPELQEAVYYWLNDIEVPETGETLTTERLQEIIDCWLND
ncbi:MAG: hypothetical protein PHV51_05660 [Methanosarcinaceae archaeon]|nr:hypothetical protein [Methanosarcinaceae archaeon]